MDGIHSAFCNCDGCAPYVPADKHVETKMDLFGWPLLALVAIMVLVGIGCALEYYLP